MAIDDPRVIKYVNEIVRPMAEKLRALKAELDDALATWHTQTAAILPVDQTEQVDDGRAAEGISRLTGNDVILVVVQMQAIQTLLNGAGVAGVISKPCVRPLAAI